MMKKILFGILVVIATASPMAIAQDIESTDNNVQSDQHLDIWGNSKNLTFSYITHQSVKFDDSEFPMQYDSRWGASLSFGKTFLWPSGAGWAGNRIKVGLNARFIDISYIRYNKYPKVNGVQLDNDDFYGPDNYPGYDDYYDDEEDFEFLSNLGTQQLHIGAGIGPAVSVNPFANVNTGLRFLRFNLYGHFNPSASMLLYKNQERESKSSWAFVPAWDLGFNVQWKIISVGIEARWGSAKYKVLDFDMDDEDYNYDNDLDIGNFVKTEKMKLKNASFRICLGLNF